MKNEKTRWILVNHPQLYFNPLNEGILQEMLGKSSLGLLEEHIYLLHWKLSLKLFLLNF